MIFAILFHCKLRVGCFFKDHMLKYFIFTPPRCSNFHNMFYNKSSVSEGYNAKHFNYIKVWKLRKLLWLLNVFIAWNQHFQMENCAFARCFDHILLFWHVIMGKPFPLYYYKNISVIGILTNYGALYTHWYSETFYSHSEEIDLCILSATFTANSFVKKESVNQI